ncbi:MAG TPA: hypothetical protein VJ949_14905 [Cryomorphaceae bacterium]|nr:hypothetical protein [Cryomorphaceae bacterium]
MIFIFDWGHETLREIGPISKTDFNTTLEAEMAWLVIRRKWFRAFFIPTIPTETEYGLIDENSNFFKIDKGIFDRYKPLAELNAAISKDEISDEEYEERRNEMGF